MERKNVGGREVLLEFHQVGGFVRVSAIDTQTNTEVTAVGSPNASEAELTQLALRKLDYVLSKRKTEVKSERPKRPGREI
jgi:hypothetical protein